MTPFDKYNLNLAGEYRVASELLLRGLTYEQIAERVKNGVDNVRITDVDSFEGDWNKILCFCDT
jgi:hypothetical protein